MYQEERLIEILNYLRNERRISVEKICELFNVSRDTARRDLVKLEEQQAILRTRGGAILPSTRNKIKDYSNRLQTDSGEKLHIGRKAASLIRNGDKIILDASTTVQSCADQLKELDCTVITNSINQAEILSSKAKLTIHLLGGQLHKEHRFLYGTSVIDRLSKYHVDHAFIGVVGISEHGLTIAHEEDGMVKRKMIERAKQVTVLADHTKVGVTDFYQYAGLEDIDLLITDRTPSLDFQELLTTHQVELLVTEEEK
ncbi:DeoR/GlpR family DNA-binding transcription regulator [Halobacillus amylolyticus]|uniref:DeoR/GlpR family DNA-binding transcription regulator n=1 Tax=Halobacillus amylolyticus TaxID=2932259 RepID=A0ABY4H7E3_9BACI|nr:DeoR/GlpR family DNA-binding transcription regulator [Halobacillus amylolyticus]UOR10791.1 DeoR/GlpR family DNA-binding transcription regulator [Halobacillus amylolyticus]